MTEPKFLTAQTKRAPLYASRWKVWDVRNVEAHRKTPDHMAFIGGWLIEAPGVHPWWTLWRVDLIHLRDIPGVRPAYKRTPDMTHEVLSGALDPFQPADPDRPDTMKMMHPVDFAVQFKAPSDQVAGRVVASAMRACANGFIHPDTDFRMQWQTSLQSTADCIASGKHPQH